jgi:hypothetical protein
VPGHPAPWHHLKITEQHATSLFLDKPAGALRCDSNIGRIERHSEFPAILNFTSSSLSPSAQRGKICAMKQPVFQ